MRRREREGEAMRDGMHWIGREGEKELSPSAASLQSGKPLAGGAQRAAAASQCEAALTAIQRLCWAIRRGRRSTCPDQGRCTGGVWAPHTCGATTLLVASHSALPCEQVLYLHARRTTGGGSHVRGCCEHGWRGAGGSWCPGWEEPCPAGCCRPLQGWARPGGRAVAGQQPAGLSPRLDAR
jgi:hypothetical protein